MAALEYTAGDLDSRTSSAQSERPKYIPTAKKRYRSVGEDLVGIENALGYRSAYISNMEGYTKEKLVAVKQSHSCATL